MSDVECFEGDCFKSAADLIMDLPDGAWLCHGEPRFRGDPVPGVVEVGDRFGHAWVETLTTVFDFSNGRALQAPIDVYYLVGAINSFHVRRYTRRQATAMMIASGHYGPWKDI